MSPTETPTRGPALPAPYVIAGVLLAIGIIVPLIVPIYARKDPELFGMPFFYWFQILEVILEAILLWIIYAIVIREDRRRRRLVRGDVLTDGGVR
jgi:putative solute:sodium symporter small subunit